MNELIIALLAQKQRTTLKCKYPMEDALVAKTKGLRVKDEGLKKLVGKGSRFDDGKQKEKYPSCFHCKKNNHSPNYCWHRPHVKCKVCN